MAKHPPPCICGINAELLKNGGQTMITWLTNIIHQAANSETLPNDWRKGVILLFYKGKGSHIVAQTELSRRGSTPEVAPDKGMSSPGTFP